MYRMINIIFVGKLKLQYSVSNKKLYMNKSIAKTRNQLQRITYKINQLKTKYTGQSNSPYLIGSESPIENQNKQVTKNRQLQPKQNKQLAIMQSQNKQRDSKHSNNQEMFHKQLKNFKNQIYNYVDQYMIINKQRQQELIEKSVQASNSRNSSKIQYEIQQRMNKVQQQTTGCMASIQQIFNVFKKQEKHVNQRLTTFQSKIKKDIKQIQFKIQNIQNIQNQKTIQAQELVEEITEKSMQNLSQLAQKLTSQIKNRNNSEQKLQSLSKQVTKLSKQYTNINFQITQLKNKKQQFSHQNNNQFHENLKQQIKEQISIQMDRNWNLIVSNFQSKYKQNQEKTKKQSIIEEKLKEMNKKFEELKDNLHKNSQSLQMLQTKLKRNEKNMLEQKKQIQKSLEQALIKQVQLNLEATYLKPRLQQIKRQLIAKTTQQIEFNKQDIMIRMEQNTFQMVNKIITQQKQRKSPKLQIDQSITSIRQDMKQLQNKLQDLIYQTFAKIQQLESSQKQKTIQNEPVEVKNTQDIIEAKLNQFETDINETIKLLYEDIENRVNQMLNHTVITDFKAQLVDCKKDIKQLQTKVHSLTLIATTSQASPEISLNQANHSSLENNKYFENLRAQVYKDMGNQIDKLSQILERTIQEIEIKVQKLDSNFSYSYERMSKIQYDNANFKDQLTRLLSKEPKIQFVKIQAQNSNLLDVLGQYSAGKYFFQGD